MKNVIKFICSTTLTSLHCISQDYHCFSVAFILRSQSPELLGRTMISAIKRSLTMFISITSFIAITLNILVFTRDRVAGIAICIVECLNERKWRWIIIMSSVFGSTDAPTFDQHVILTCVKNTF